LYQDNLWNINADLDKNHVIKFNNLDQSITLSSFKAESENEHIFVSGNYHSKNDFALELELDHVNLDKVASYNSNFELKGNIDLSLNIRRSFSDNTFNLDGEISDLNVNNQSMGDFKVFTSGNTQLNSYELNAVLDRSGKKVLTVKGALLGLDQKPKLDLDLVFDEFELNFLTPLGKDNINNIRGTAKGAINLWGPLDGIKHSGDLKIDNAGFTLPSLNTDYQFENETLIGLIDQKFEIKTYNIIQEFINNILKHSKASNAVIKLKEKDGQILVEVSDDGIGFDKTKIGTKDGLGINQIEARIHMMRGKLSIISYKGEGTQIKVELPIQEKEATNLF
jgi:hypothetical protein